MRSGLAVCGLLMMAVLGGACSHGTSPTGARRISSAVNATGPLKRIVIAIDGLSFEAFQVARERGMFPEFTQVAKHVAPFPSMTDVSWSKIFQTSSVFGNAGRIRYPEAAYFDSGARVTVNDPREYFRRLSHPTHYFNAFDVFYNPYLEALMYLPNKEVSREEVRSVINQVKALPEKETIIAYFGAVDSAAHTQRDQLYTVIEQISQAVTDLAREYREAGREIEFDIISDHGNVGNFKEGGEEVYLQAFPTLEMLKSAGLNLVTHFSPNGGDSEVQSPLLALGNYAPFHFSKLSNAKRLAEHAMKDPRIDLAIYLDSGNENARTFKVIGKDGSVHIRHDRMTRKVSVQRRGEPVIFESHHPRAVERIVEAFSDTDFESADLYLTLKDGYYFDNPLSGNVQMVRTHGSLSARSTFGVLASNKVKLPQQVMSKDVLPTLKVSPNDVFARQLAGVVESAGLNKPIPTFNDDFSDKTLFYRLTQFLNESRYFFDVKNADALMKAFAVHKAILERRPSGPSQFDFKSMDLKSLIGPEDVGLMADLILKYKDADKIQADSEFQELKTKIQRDGLRLDPNSADSQSFMDKLKSMVKRDDAVALKQMVMKLWALPHLLKRSFNIPEMETISDPRLEKMKEFWQIMRENLWKSRVSSDQFAKHAEGARDEARLLFEEIYRERKLMAKIAPVPIAPQFSHHDANVALVFIPGIYDSIFDGEIFKTGLDSIAENFGVRILRPPVESGCSSRYNGQKIMDFIKADHERLIERRKRVQRYFILGYSKGGVDALTALLLDREFTAKYILGLATIASPLKGASILNTADLPVDLVNLLSRKDIPAECLTKERASSTMTPSAMMTFWNKNRSQLIGLTRYYSMSFVSEPEESHPWMKVSKLIGRFKELNDGVVTLSASQFPDQLGAIDLGTLRHTDHLAGIVASDFAQRPFMEALWVTLSQLDAFHPKMSMFWNMDSMRRALAMQKGHLRLAFSSDSAGNVSVDLKKQRSVDWGAKAEKLWGADLGLNWKTVENFYAQSIMDVLSRVEAQGPKKKISSYVPEFQLPMNTIGFDADNRLDAKDYPNVLGGSSVTPITSKSHPAPRGIEIKYRHPELRDFLNEYQFSVESNAPADAEYSKDNGWMTENFGPEQWGRMSSNGTSTRLTSFAMRFNLSEFSHMDLKFRVDKNTVGADPIKGGNGKDDSAFQLWLMLRKIPKNMSLAERAKVNPEKSEQAVFGYYWAEPNGPRTLKKFEIYENTYSQKNFVAVVLPPMKQMVLGFEDSELGKVQDVSRNVREDVENAFGKGADYDWEVIGITFQQDSNDSKSSSVAAFKELRFF